MIALIVILLLAGLVAGDAGAEIYRSFAADGSVVYTNTPYKKNDRLVMKNRSRATTPSPVQAQTQSALKNSSMKAVALKAPAASEKPLPVHARKAAYSGLVEEKAKKHNVDPKLVKSVIHAESNWNHRAVSPKGAMGLMQLMPQTADLMGVNNPFDPEQNIEGGVKYLRYLLTKFQGNLTMAIAAYNAGPKTVERKGGVPAIPETVTYVQRVIGDYTGVTPMISLPRTKWSGSATNIRKVVTKDGTILYTNM